MRLFHARNRLRDLTILSFGLSILLLCFVGWWSVHTNLSTEFRRSAEISQYAVDAIKRRLEFRSSRQSLNRLTNTTPGRAAHGDLRAHFISGPLSIDHVRLQGLRSDRILAHERTIGPNFRVFVGVQERASRADSPRAQNRWLKFLVRIADDNLQLRDRNESNVLTATDHLLVRLRDERGAAVRIVLSIDAADLSHRNDRLESLPAVAMLQGFTLGSTWETRPSIIRGAYGYAFRIGARNNDPQLTEYVLSFQLPVDRLLESELVDAGAPIWIEWVDVDESGVNKRVSSDGRSTAIARDGDAEQTGGQVFDASFFTAPEGVSGDVVLRDASQRDLFTWCIESATNAPCQEEGATMGEAFLAWLFLYDRIRQDRTPRDKLITSSYTASDPEDGASGTQLFSISIETPRTRLFRDGLAVSLPQIQTTLLSAGVLLVLGVLIGSGLTRVRKLAASTETSIAEATPLSVDEKHLSQKDEIGFLTRSMQTLVSKIMEEQKILRTRVESKRQISAVVGHEIRSPLQSLQARLSGDEQGLRQLRRIEHATSVILAADKLEEAFRNAKPREIDIADLLDQICQQADDTIFEGIADDNLFVMADTEQLEQVIDHVLSNANDFKADSTNVWVSLERGQNNASIHIENKGPRIDDTESIFELGSSTRRSDDGVHLGQGLYMARGYVEKIGGTIAADNTPSGVVFSIKVPLTEPAVS